MTISLRIPDDSEVSESTGFLPPAVPLQRLPPTWNLWEDVLSAARGGGIVGESLRLGGGSREDKWRKTVEELPELPYLPLTASLPLARRAHLVLAFILHFYVHTQPARRSGERPYQIPASISVPLLGTSKILGLPPILTYADTVLYNSLPDDVSSPFRLYANGPTRIIETFTNTPSEIHFYLTSAKCEMFGVRALSIMREAGALAHGPIDSEIARRMSDLLSRLAVEIDMVGRTILSVREGCVPAVFYHQIRPWFRGGDAAGAESVGWDFTGLTLDVDLVIAENPDAVRGREAGGLVKLSGTSAGQSSLIHSFDVFLDIDHMTHRPAKAAIAPQSQEATFLSRMKQYMPGPHREFLSFLATTSTPIRALVLHNADRYPDLRKSYDAAVHQLQVLRERHMQIVSLFIVQQARPTPPPSAGEGEQDVEELRGTGGSALFHFLKLNRDNTRRAKIAV